LVSFHSLSFGGWGRSDVEIPNFRFSHVYNNAPVNKLYYQLTHDYASKKKSRSKNKSDFDSQGLAADPVARKNKTRKQKKKETKKAQWIDG